VVQTENTFETLNDKRRRRHREMMNDGRRPRTFQPNDIVVVRKQVKSKDGQPAKLTLRTKGPYRVIEQAGTNSYHIQKIPALQSRTKRPGKIRKEAAMRLTKLPSTLVIHKRVNTADTRFMETATELVHNPLERSLGIFDFGKYARAAPDREYAFVKLNEMWDEPIHEEDSDDDEEDETMTTTTTTDNTTDARLQLPTEDRRTNKRKRNQQNNESEQRPSTRARTTHQEINRRELHQLHDDIKESQDKVLIIKKRE
jgi:hypothetical protein